MCTLVFRDKVEAKGPMPESKANMSRSYAGWSVRAWHGEPHIVPA